MAEDEASRELIWQGPSWSLHEIWLTVADGTAVRRGLVDHPGSVLILPVEGQHVLMLRQYRLSLAQEILELPAGTRHPGESFANCARRELREETGYRASSLTGLGHLWLAPGISNERMELFLAEDLAPDPLPPDPDERILVERRDLHEVARMALSGEIPDAKTVAAILRLLAHRGELELL